MRKSCVMVFWSSARKTRLRSEWTCPLYTFASCVPVGGTDDSNRAFAYALMSVSGTGLGDLSGKR